MSKKNKALKQLIKAQMQANAVASLQGKDISAAPAGMAPQAGFTPAQVVAAEKQVNEAALIKKDIRLSLLLISFVIICLFVIYFIDKSNPFLLSLADQIFSLISK